MRDRSDANGDLAQTKSGRCGKRPDRLATKLNHFALSFDTSNNFVGPAQIQEDVTLDKKADQYTGTFKTVQYDASGNVLAEVVGQVAAIRITVNTTIQQVL